jgi:hypothetical protein
VVSAKLSARAALSTSGALPDNVNYEVKSSLTEFGYCAPAGTQRCAGEAAAAPVNSLGQIRVIIGRQLPGGVQSSLIEHPAEADDSADDVAGAARIRFPFTTRLRHLPVRTAIRLGIF